LKQSQIFIRVPYFEVVNHLPYLGMFFYHSSGRVILMVTKTLAPLCIYGTSVPMERGHSFFFERVHGLRSANKSNSVSYKSV